MALHQLSCWPAFDAGRQLCGPMLTLSRYPGQAPNASQMGDNLGGFVACHWMVPALWVHVVLTVVPHAGDAGGCHTFDTWTSTGHPSDALTP